MQIQALEQMPPLPESLSCYIQAKVIVTTLSISALFACMLNQYIGLIPPIRLNPSYALLMAIIQSMMIFLND